MKGYSIISFVILVSSALCYGRPIEMFSDIETLTARGVCNGEQCTRDIASDIGVILESRAGPSATAKAVIAFINLPANKAAFTKPLCFYSGFTMVTTPKSKTATKITAYSKIGAFMASHGCNNIDNLVSLAGQSAATKSWSNEPDWLEVSRALAKHA
ncbi:hypothetical protein C8J56DRAFT_392596 [Mycena floridula]|nr:hypothetical protein C8J56DRAFT_392596 [Mycena floridula]